MLWKEIHIRTQRRGVGRHLVDTEIANLVGAVHFHRVFGQYAGAVQRAAVHQHADERQIIWPCRVKGVAHAIDLGRRRRGDLVRRPLPLSKDMGLGQTRLHVALQLKSGVRHPEGVKERLFAIGVDPLATGRLYHLAKPIDAGAIIPACPRLKRQRVGMERG